MARKRYAHHWQPSKDDAQPSRIICVDCEADVERVSASPLVERERLTRWYASSARLSSGRVVRRGHAEGAGAAEWWARLEQFLSPNTATWVFMANSGRCLALLGFWREMEQERLWPVGSNSRDCYGSRPSVSTVRVPQSKSLGDVGQRDNSTVQDLQRAGRGEATAGLRGDQEGDRASSFGCVILEDPPTILILARKGKAGIIKVVDLRNFGIALETWEGNARERAEQQCEWVARAIGELRDNTLGSMRCTAGAQAVSSFRRRLMPVVPYVHNFGSALRLERDCYHGGRCEAFRIGRIEGPVYHLDVRNLYPWCGWHHDMPHMLARMYREPDCETATALVLREMCFGDVTLQSPSADYPVVARLSPTGPPRPVSLHAEEFNGLSRGQTVYPTGRFRACLAGPDLRDSVERGRVVSWHRLAVYHGCNLFAPFYATWYGLLGEARKSGDVPTQQWIKRVMVSFVGKLAETGKTWEPAHNKEFVKRFMEQGMSYAAAVKAAGRPDRGPYDSWPELGKDGVWRRYRNVAWYTQREDVSAESAESVPGIAAWITSLARVRLLNLLRLAGYGHVYYVDTDAIVCDQEGYDALRLAGEVRVGDVGYLRLLGVHGSADIRGIKHYALDGEWRAAGLPRGTVVQSDAGGYGYYRRPTSAELGERRAPDARETLLGYDRHHAYLHGRVTEDGRVIPWEIGTATSADGK